MSGSEQPRLGSVVEEARELLAYPFEADERNDMQLELLRQQTELLTEIGAQLGGQQQTTGPSTVPRSGGSSGSGNRSRVGGVQRVSGDTFVYRGEEYAVPSVVDRGDAIATSNQSYSTATDTYENEGASVDAGERKLAAAVETTGREVFLLRATNATLHSTIRYEYVFNDAAAPDPALSGSTPWATPPDLYTVGSPFVLVEDSVELYLNEQSGNTEYDETAGALIGVRVEV